MRGLCLVLLVGCAVRSDPTVEEPPVFDPGSRPTGGCHDSGCSTGQVCARTGVCLPPSQVRAIHISWTVSGKPASPTSCASAQNLRLDLNSSSDAATRLAYQPVPCAAGRFTVDKSPISINRALLVREMGDGLREGMIDATTGEVLLDLPY